MSDFIKSSYLQQIADDILAMAKRQGATASEVSISRSQGKSIGVRKQQLETVESIQDQSMSVTVYFGQKKGSASSSDFSALPKTVAMACDIASYTQGDEAFGLADKNRQLSEHQDLALDYPQAIETQDLVAQAMACEQAALEYSSKISNSEGASVDTSRSVAIYANSQGFNDFSMGTRYDLSCSVIAGEQDAMQRDYDYSVAREYHKLTDSAVVGRHTAEKAVAKLNGRNVKTGSYPVVFDTAVAPGLFAHLIQGISGMAIYHKTSFLLDAVGERLFPGFVSIEEDPHLLGGLSSAAYDAEGVATQAKSLIKDGVLQTYIMSSYSARKLGLSSTANAGGVFNLNIKPSLEGQAALLAQMHTGFLITEFMGSGVNMMTGDYSRGASGFWVENGMIQYPVDEVTVAGNLKKMWQGIVAIADDVDERRSTRTGSVLIDSMVVSGN